MIRSRSDDGYTLFDLSIAAVILAVVLAIVGDYLFSASNTVSRSAAHQDDNAAAQTALGLIETNVRFACDMSIAGGVLYVENACGNPEPACTEWSQTGSQLIEKTPPGGTSAVANGISGLTFSTNNAYNALVTVQFKLRQPQDSAGDPDGVSATQTLTARNMPGAVATGSALCS